MRLGLLIIPALLALPHPAAALTPKTHFDLAFRYCRTLAPNAFCRRIAQADYNTDAREWTALSAHAQREDGEARCDAADKAIGRVDSLARQAMAADRAGKTDVATDLLGRVLHTIQDECAHHGMMNPQHAFFSLEDKCTGEGQSPDTQPAAISCAKSQTSRAMQAIVSAFPASSRTRMSAVCGSGFGAADLCSDLRLVGAFSACQFLGVHDQWDGVDTRWHSTKVGDALIAALRHGLSGASGSAVKACVAGNIDPASPAPKVDVSHPSCAPASVGCFLEGDDPNSNVDPYGDEPEESGGCATTTPGAAGALAAVLVLVLRRRRRA